MDAVVVGSTRSLKKYGSFIESHLREERPYNFEAHFGQDLKTAIMSQLEAIESYLEDHDEGNLLRGCLNEVDKKSINSQLAVCAQGRRDGETIWQFEIYVQRGIVIGGRLGWHGKVVPKRVMPWDRDLSSST